MIIVNSKDMQEIDRVTIDSFGIPSFTLMESAGRSAYNYFLKSFLNLERKKIGVVAGKGNNGGDGFVIARYLINSGFSVEVFLIAKEKDIKENPKKNLTLLKKLKTPIFEIFDESSFKKHKKKMERVDIWIDAIFGIGLKSNVKGIFKLIIDFINRQKREVFSIDMPSGIDADSGKILNCAIRAFATITFAFPKIGHFLLDGEEYSGKLYVADIGIPKIMSNSIYGKQFLLQFDYFKDRVIKRAKDSHKGKNGHILTFAGSKGKSGALIMLSKAALRSGAGLVSMVIPEEINNTVEANVIEGMTIPFKKDVLKILLDNSRNKSVVAIGPGVGEKNREVCLKFMKESTIPLVIDADAINFIAEEEGFLKDLRTTAILTPHPKEMARLIGTSVKEVQENRFYISKEFAQNNGVHLILKGHRTIIAHPDGEVYINSSGNSGMAVGGMGDVLCGMIAGFIGQGYDIKTASHLAVFLHGVSGDIVAQKKGDIGYLPTDLIEMIPEALKLWKK